MAANIETLIRQFVAKLQEAVREGELERLRALIGSGKRPARTAARAIVRRPKRGPLTCPVMVDGKECGKHSAPRLRLRGAQGAAQARQGRGARRAQAASAGGTEGGGLMFKRIDVDEIIDTIKRLHIIPAAGSWIRANGVCTACAVGAALLTEDPTLLDDVRQGAPLHPVGDYGKCGFSGSYLRGLSNSFEAQVCGLAPDAAKDKDAVHRLYSAAGGGPTLFSPDFADDPAEYDAGVADGEVLFVRLLEEGFDPCAEADQVAYAVEAD